MELTNEGKTRKTFTTEQPSVVQQFAQRCAENIDLEHLNLFLIFTWISFIFYVLDIVIELYWLTKFYNEENELYLRLNLAFWTFPAILMNLRSFSLYIKEMATENNPRDYLPKESVFRWIMKWLGPFRLRIIARYWDTIKCARKAKQIKEKNDNTANIYLAAMIWEDAEIVQLHDFDCFIETTLQILINLYITVTDGSHFGVFSVICLIISVMSLSWAMISYNQKICLMGGIKKSDDGQQNPASTGIINFKSNDGVIDLKSNDAIDGIKNINWKYSAILFLANILFMVCRLLVFSFFAHFYGRIVWPTCLLQLTPIFIWHMTENYSFIDSLRISILHVITSLLPTEKGSEKEKHPRISPAVYRT